MDTVHDATSRTAVRAFLDHGFTHFVSVPYAHPKGLFRILEDSRFPARHVPAPREDSAVGVAFGLTLAGARTAVFMRNSGLDYSLNVLTSLMFIYDVHLPLVVSWRGHDDNDDNNDNDEGERRVVGRAVTPLLDASDLPWTILDPQGPRRSADDFFEQHDGGRRTTVLIVKEGV
ncbi:hypothetical protein [Streptomyces sp. CC224B]|uniref:hypothetical protein n=1 Tax=Streptomyces sp. CC224B TaxID=3044571 RepID=UPI0024A7F917|nr:hypothetical protein [Streptomyces sp. CC224B]